MTIPNLVPLATRQSQPAPLAETSLCQRAAVYGQEKVTKQAMQSIGQAMFAGAFIALAFVFYLTVTTGASGDWGMVRLVGGLAFSLGLMLVVICGGELFTSSVLSSVAWAQKRVSTRQLLVCWGRVYLGNFCGAMIMLALILSAKMYLLDGGLWGLNALKVAQHKLHHSWGQAFTLGILCNMLVCLGVWMTFASKEALTKAILLMLPVAMFVSSGFEHSIANLFMVPLGIAIKQLAIWDWYQIPGFTAQQFNDLTLLHFLANNLIPVTAGNIVGGGIVVGLGYWWIDAGKARVVPEKVPLRAVHLEPVLSRDQQGNEQNSYSDNAANTISILSSKVCRGETQMPKSIQKLNVSALMEQTPFTLTPDLSVYEGLKQLNQAQLRGAPVVDAQQRLLGFVSQQDLLRSLWSEEFVRGIGYKVADLMQTRVLTVTPDDAVADLIEVMVVDRDKLFPVNDMGVLTGNTYASYEERLRHASASKPSCFPVVSEGKLVGVITREAIVTKVCAVYG
ncbi:MULTISPECIES: formate transporter FocA [Shewanella]|uniref:formate transporter FocA n=1 Tax=Shewanella TaxID=22 RepID=UPI001EFDA009|nr:MULTISPECIES: formate transporter FocA [Shewanella]MCG9746901.1 formate transporter FocA [Shewanella sp. Isolate8]MCL2908445.1 formate transporter FocA [Shewanella aquimarina]